MRTPKYKNTIVNLLQKTHLMSLADLQKKIPNADFSTLFRNVEKMIESGEVRRIVLDRDTILYELEGAHQHHHFVCSSCGTVESIHEDIVLSGKRIIEDILIKGQCEQCTAS